MKEQKPEYNESSDLAIARVYTYEDLMDPEVFSSAWRRKDELLDISKSRELSEEERAEYNDIYSAWFQHLFDPI